MGCLGHDIMDKHRGQIVEYIIRKNGHNISDIAKVFGITRRSLYNWFDTKQLRTGIIYRMGLIIRHDFSVEFPELFISEDFKNINTPPQKIFDGIKTAENTPEESQWKDKYLNLLEMYNGALINHVNNQSVYQAH